MGLQTTDAQTLWTVHVNVYAFYSKDNAAVKKRFHQELRHRMQTEFAASVVMLMKVPGK